MEIPITIVTTGVLGLMFLVHTVRVIMARSATEVSLGDGGNQTTLRLIRTHGNFAEYIPLLLIILLLLEVQGVSAIILQMYAGVVICGRFLHAYGIVQNVFWARVVGMIGTMTALGLGSIGIILLGLG